MKTEEGKLKDKVKALLKRPGCYYNMPVPTGYGTPMLDFVGCYKGRFFMIETKSKGYKLTPRQDRVVREVQAADGMAIWHDDYEMLRKDILWFFERVDSGRI